MKPRHHDDDAATDDGDDEDEDAARPDPIALLYEAMFSRDDSPDVLFDINFTAFKVAEILFCWSKKGKSLPSHKTCCSSQ